MSPDDLHGEKFALTSSRNFPEWLAATGSSVAFTTYQAGKLFLLGVRPDGRLSVFERTFARSMGLGVSVDGLSLVLATQYQIKRFDNVLPDGQASPEGFDAVYAPHAGWVTGDVDAHDVGFASDGRPLFVNTKFSCLATVSDGHSFRPIWTPPFISRLAPEDRCHLNGLAVADGLPRYVTAVSRSDAADGWRDRRADGGIVIDVEKNEIVVDGLSMPRENRTFSGLPLDAALQSRNTDPRCGLAIIDLETGDMTAWVRIEGVVRELYDVAVLPNVRRPSLIGFKTDEVRYVLSIDQ